MEYRNSMIRMAALLLIAGLMAVISPLVQATEARTLVLVAANSKSEFNLSGTEARRLFLGLPVAKENRPLVALINHTDSLLYQVFLQKIIFMSANTYERQLLANVARQGGQRPRYYTDWQELLSALRAQPEGVAYMWREQIPADAGLVVVAEIWRLGVD